MTQTQQANPFEGDRTGTIVGAFGGLLGVIGLVGGNGGYILHLQLEGVWRTLFMFYPLVLVIAAVVGGVLVALKRDLEAVGLFGLPVVAAIAYYFALIHLRPV